MLTVKAKLCYRTTALLAGTGTLEFKYPTTSLEAMGYKHTRVEGQVRLYCRVLLSTVYSLFGRNPPFQTRD